MIEMLHSGRNLTAWGVKTCRLSLPAKFGFWRPP